MQQQQPKKPVISVDSPVMGIFCDQEFAQLTEKEKNYSYYFYKACWEGQKICYFQKSYESPAIYIILHLVFSGQPLSELKAKFLSTAKGVTSSDYDKILAYCSGFFNNCGNLLSFGDSKFIPDVSEEVFLSFVKCSHNYSNEGSFRGLIDSLWKDVSVFMFSFEGKYQRIGLPGQQEGSSGYYSGNITKEEIQDADELLQTLNISSLNTRLVKLSEDSFCVLVASADCSPFFQQQQLQPQETHFYKKRKYSIVRGDFAAFLRRVAQQLEQALPFAANSAQKEMLERYIVHFRGGDIEQHKASQRAWVRDKGPVVETNIGFIETYLDPLSQRAEWEGFVSLVNKEQSRKTQNFVENAPEFLKLMPWPADFEKDRFLKPDFTSLSILAFASSGVPLGINIPNYDDIRQTEGFKNVYLGNCVPQLKTVLFLVEEDVKVLRDNFLPLVFHKVVFHELLGHGCGKLLQRNEDGTFNFAHGELKNPVTQAPVDSYYKEKDTWQSIFKGLSNPYEECRADSVALFFSTFPKSYEVLQPEQANKWEELAYAQFLEFVYQGVYGLQFFNAQEKKWGQAHINGRWVILQVLIEAGNGFVNIHKCKHPNDAQKDWVSITVDRKQVLTTGKKAMADFLLKMNVFKATADYTRASEMFFKYSEVNDKFLEIRQIVIDNKKPRRLELQGYLEKGLDGQISYQKFEENFEGVVQSYMKQHPYFDLEMLDLWNQHRQVMRPAF